VAIKSDSSGGKYCLSTYSEVVEAVMSATSRFCGNHLGLFLSPIDQKPWLLLFCVSFVPKQTTKLHQSRMTAASKSACLLPRGLDRRIRCGAKVVP